LIDGFIVREKYVLPWFFSALFMSHENTMTMIMLN
jgi:hypothetical protein